MSESIFIRAANMLKLKQKKQKKKRRFCHKKWFDLNVIQPEKSLDNFQIKSIITLPTQLLEKCIINN